MRSALTLNRSLELATHLVLKVVFIYLKHWTRNLRKLHPASDYCVWIWLNFIDFTLLKFLLSKYFARFIFFLIFIIFSGTFYFMIVFPDLIVFYIQYQNQYVWLSG